MQSRQQDVTTQLFRRLDRMIRETIGPAEIQELCRLETTSRTVGGEPVPFDIGTSGDFARLSDGEPWGRAWDTMWLHLTGTVPAAPASVPGDISGKQLELDVDLGFTSAQSGFQAEGLVYSADGQIIKALNPLNHRLVLTADPGDPLEFWVEAAANPTLNTADGTNLIPLSHLGSWNTSGSDLLYRFKGARLVLRDVSVSSLLQDIAVLRGIATHGVVDRRRKELILASLEEMLGVLDPEDVPTTAGQARAVLEPVLHAPAAADAMQLFAVGHAHIDSAWLWPLRETIRKCARTFSNVLTLMDQDPAFVFACSSAQQFQWMKDHYPELYERIKIKVEEGRFVPVGGMWVESDTNMPSGEALARQFIAGQGFFEREFGIHCREVWLPDSFGYSAGLPQIARLAGTRWFFGQKLSWNRTNRMPHHTFVWEGIDGSKILSHFTPVETYNSDLSPAELAFASENFEDHRGFSGGLVPFGYGDGGGGPTREMLEAGHRAADIEGLPQVRFSTPSEFFGQVERECSDPAVWRGEMYLELHRGTYTSQAATKYGNRRAEALLRQAELWCATAAVRTGFPYPDATLKRIWERTLLLQFHDILPGTSISWVHADAHRMHEEDAHELVTMIDEAVAALVGEGTEPLTVNGSPFRRGDVPPLGIAESATPRPSSAVLADDDGYVLRNDMVELRIDRNGAFPSLIDLRSGRDLFGPGHPGNVFHLHQDIPTDWDAWDVDEHYRQLLLETPRASALEQCPDTGSAVRVVRQFGSSTIRQTIRLNNDRPAVDIETTVDWHEQQKLLKLAFPFRIDARHSSAETQFGFVERPTHANTSWDAAKFEIVAHRWIHVGDGILGAGLVNNRTYGHDVTRIGDPESQGSHITQIRQTLLRGARYPDPEADQGLHTFKSRILVTTEIGGAVESAYDLDTPMLEVRGSGARVEPLVTVEGTGVVCHTVKLAEDGSEDIIVRVFESLGRPTRASIFLDWPQAQVVDLLEHPLGDPIEIIDGSISLPMRAFEILTLRIAR